MNGKDSWDWQPGQKVVADLSRLGSSYAGVHEYTASPDGQTLAALVKTEDDKFAVWVNGQEWPDKFELAWYLRFSPAGKLIALVRIDDEWTIAADGKSWQERFDYVWDPLFGNDGLVVGIKYKRENLYGIAIDDKIWEEGFVGLRDFCLSPDGLKAAATVQVKALPEAAAQPIPRGRRSCPRHQSTALRGTHNGRHRPPGLAESRACSGMPPSRCHPCTPTLPSEGSVQPSHRRSRYSAFHIRPAHAARFG